MLGVARGRCDPLQNGCRDGGLAVLLLPQRLSEKRGGPPVALEPEEALEREEPPVEKAEVIPEVDGAPEPTTARYVGRSLQGRSVLRWRRTSARSTRS